MGMKARDESINYGRNADVSDHDGYIKCSHCEFLVSLKRVKSVRDGISLEEKTIKYDFIKYDKDNNYNCVLPYDSREKTVYDPVVSAGCPKCGTYLYKEVLDG